LNKIVLVLLALTAVSGVGVLSWNNFVVELQPFQIFNSFAEFDNPQCACVSVCVCVCVVESVLGQSPFAHRQAALCVCVARSATM